MMAEGYVYPIAYLEYWNGNAWTEGNRDVPLGKDTFNQVSLHNLNTSRLRVVMKNNVESTGIRGVQGVGLLFIACSRKIDCAA